MVVGIIPFVGILVGADLAWISMNLWYILGKMDGKIIFFSNQRVVNEEYKTI